jgi:hypothetical protein
MWSHAAAEVVLVGEAIVKLLRLSPGWSLKLGFNGWELWSHELVMKSGEDLAVFPCFWLHLDDLVLISGPGSCSVCMADRHLKTPSKTWGFIPVISFSAKFLWLGGINHQQLIWTYMNHYESLWIYEPDCIISQRNWGSDWHQHRLRETLRRAASPRTPRRHRAQGPAVG